MRLLRLWLSVTAVLLVTCLSGWSQQPSARRKIIIDQDASGPAGTDQQAILLLVQSPQTEVLGVTVVTGDAWLKEEVAHTLRMLEIIGRTDIPVVPRSRVSAGQAQGRNGTLAAAIRLGSVAGCVDSAALPRAGSTGRNARGQAHHQTGG